MINHLTSVETATKGLASATELLAVEQERLAQMQAKSQEIQQVLEGLEHPPGYPDKAASRRTECRLSVFDYDEWSAYRI